MPLLALRFAASLALAFAGSPPGPTLTVRVPFDFRAGASRFGPGEYVISLSTAGSVRLEGRDRGRSVTIQAPRSRAAGSSEAPAVSFRAYGDQRFLASVHAEGRAWELAPSTDERSASLHWGRPPTVLSLKAGNSSGRPS
jgi:hypothetical protein